MAGPQQVSVSLYPEETEALRARARANDRSLSAELRRAIRYYIAAETELEKKMSQVAAGGAAPGSAIAGQRDAIPQ